MITLIELRNSINEYLDKNPESADYNVITFDYMQGTVNEINPIESAQWIVTDTRKQQFIFDTAEEITDDIVEEQLSIDKVIIL